MSKRMLVAYSMDSTKVQTTREYLAAIKAFSGYEIEYLHVTGNANIVSNLDRYDAVFHNYCARLCFKGHVSETYQNRLRKFRGLKVLAVQDEYDRTNELKSAIKDLAFDIVLTCVPQEFVEYVYPRVEFPNVEFVTVLTGYVPEADINSTPLPKPLADRGIFIGYRGRDIGGRYGQLGFDKYEIGRRMKEICDARGIATDIAMDEESRIYGTDWYEFVGNCRAMLGSESGSNVFDFDGSIAAKYGEMMRANNGVAPTYGEFRAHVDARDGEIDMGQISPRIFECAIMRTPMVLFKGRYSDAVAPAEHYIALEKDFSNIEEVLAKLEDVPALEAMAARAHAHLVQSGKFGYREFIINLRSLCDSKLQQKNWRANEKALAANLGLKSGDRRLEILTELPSDIPKSSEEFMRKHEHLGIVSMLAIYRASIPSYAEQTKRWRNCIVAHSDILDEIDSLERETGRVSNTKRARSDLFRRLVESCEAIAVAQGAYEGAMSDIEASRSMVDSDAYRALEADEFYASKSITTAYVIFFESILADVVALNRQTMAEIGRLKSRAGLASRLRLIVKAIAALREAPWRAFFVRLVQVSPTVHGYAKRIRRMVHGG